MSNEEAMQMAPGDAGAGSMTAENFTPDEFTQALGDSPLPQSPEAAPPAMEPADPAGNEDSSSANPSPAPTDAAGLRSLYDIPVNITVVLGRTHMEVSNLLSLGKGAVVELDRKVGESIDILVNNRLVARGEVVLVEGQLGVTLTEIIKNKAAA